MARAIKKKSPTPEAFEANLPGQPHILEKEETAPPKKAKPMPVIEMITPSQRERMVRELAYGKAHQEGFAQEPSHYWYVAEQEVEQTLKQKGVQSFTP